jgi:predicted kinase
VKFNEGHLYIFSGLPGAGKTTLAKCLAAYVKASFLRIDTVEVGISDLCNCEVEGEGYRLSYRIAADNLKIGNSVVADSCNPIELTRREWCDVALLNNSFYTNIEVICSDKDEHKMRIEERECEIPGSFLPSWKQVVEHEYELWKEERVIIDTAGKSIEECFNDLVFKLKLPYNNEN